LKNTPQKGQNKPMIKPRLKNSLRFQELPIDSIKLMKDVIQKNFKKYLKDKTIFIQGFIYTEEILLRVGFQSEGIAQRNFEASISYSAKKKDIMERIYIALDALGSMIDQYFKAEGDIEMPITWNEFKLDGESVYLQTSNENTSLEAVANKLLSDA
jgi:hypothetical protein